MVSVNGKNGSNSSYIIGIKVEHLQKKKKKDYEEHFVAGRRTRYFKNSIFQTSFLSFKTLFTSSTWLWIDLWLTVISSGRNLKMTWLLISLFNIVFPDCWGRFYEGAGSSRTQTSGFKIWPEVGRRWKLLQSFSSVGPLMTCSLWKAFLLSFLKNKYLWMKVFSPLSGLAPLMSDRVSFISHGPVCLTTMIRSSSCYPIT